MKPLEFNVLRMILLMTAEYSFCEAFEKEGFSPDASLLRNTYDALGKINHKAEQALKRVYKEHIVEGFDEDIKKYNEIVLPPEIQINDVIKVAQIVEDTMPKRIVEVLSGREDFSDTTTNGDRVYGANSIEEAHLEVENGTEPNVSEEDKSYLNELRVKMGAKDFCYIQLIK